MTDTSLRDKVRLQVGSVLALLVAALLAATVVAPAETGFDPFGSGAALGIRKGVDPAVHSLHATAPVQDQVRFTLDPFQSVEYKYRLDAGSTLVYGWQATGPVVFEMHGELDGAPAGASERYHIGRGADASGRFSAPAAGVHGWYWQNRGFETVEVLLTASGFMAGARLYDRSGVREVSLSGG